MATASVPIPAGNGSSLDPMQAIQALQETISEMKTNYDQSFLVTFGFIIFFMQTGFAFLEAGAVRSKNTTNILLKNLLDSFIGGLSYWLVGYGLAFGDGNRFLGMTKFASVGLPEVEYAKWFFQFAFAAASATIISGAVAERCSFPAYVAYAVLLCGFVYPVGSHWAWSEDGWLKGTEFHDFAGSSVVHITGGSASLIACYLLGPRIDRIDHVTGELRTLRGHSVPLAALGGFILIFGFLAFNGASQGSISNPGDGAQVSLAVANTVLSGSSAGLSTLVLHRLGIFTAKGEETSWSFLITLNGALTGMVAICSGCNILQNWAAVVVGFGAASTYLAFRRVLEIVKIIDDPLDAAAVHLGGGMWGMIGCGLLSNPGLLAGNPKILAWNLAGSLSIALWSFSMTGICCAVLKYFKVLRISEQDEIRGLDVVKHQEPAYPVDAWAEEQYSTNGLILPLGGASMTKLNEFDGQFIRTAGPATISLPGGGRPSF